MVWLLAERKLFRSQCPLLQTGVLYCHPSAECHGDAPYGACPEQHDPGHPLAKSTHGRKGSSLAARHRPCRHRHAGSGRKGSPQTGLDETPRRPRSREIPRTRVGLERETRGHYYPTAQKAGLFVRLVTRTLYDGPGLFPVRAKSLRRSLQEGFDLPWKTNGQLGPRSANRSFR